MLLSLPIVYHGEYLNRKTNQWAAHNYVRADEVFEIAEMDFGCELAATGLNAPGLPEDLDVYWHDESCWIRDEGAVPTVFDPYDVKSLLRLARGAAVKLHCIGYAGIWAPTVQDHWERWAERKSRSPNPATHSACRNLTLEAERERMRGFTAGLRLYKGVVYRRVGTPSYSVDDEGDVTVVFDRRAGESGSFRLDRGDDLKAFLTDNFGPEAAAACSLAEIVLPHAFAWDDERTSFLAAVSQTMRTHAKYGSKIGDKGQARKRLAAAWEEYFRDLGDRDLDDHDLDAFADEMEAFAAALRSAKYKVRGWVYNPIPETEKAIELERDMRQAGNRIDIAVARWRIRPLTASEDETNGPPAP